MYQYLHLVSSAGVALPTDVWYPSTKNIKPQSSDQVALGFSYLPTKELLFTYELYYKRLQNQLEFVNVTELFNNNQLKQKYAIEKGKAYCI